MMEAAIRVLYVDDETGLLEIGKMFLEELGEFSVTTIDSGSAALYLLKKEKFDTIVSDYQMAGMDGIQFLVEVRARFGQIPFILFTGKGREEVVIQAINNGADFYLQKGGELNSQFAELMLKIRQAVSRKRAEAALVKSTEELLKKNKELNESYEKIAKAEEELRHQIEEIKTSQDALERSKEKFFSLYMHMVEGAALHEILYNEQGIPVDYKIIETNSAFEKQLGVTRDDVIGKTSREAYRVNESPYLEIYAQVALTGKPAVFETYFPPLEKHFSISAYSPYKGSFATIFEDITEHKRMEENLRLHHIELEIQNENLIRTQQELEISLDRYFDLYDMAPVGYLTINDKGWIVTANLTVAKLLSVDRSTLINLPLTKLIFQDDQDKFYFQFKKLTKNKDQQSFELRLKRQGNSPFWAQMIMAFNLPGREIELGYNIMVIDITQRKQMEDALKESEEKFREIFHSASDGMHLHEIDENYAPGKYIDVNETVCRMLQYTKEELMDKSPTDISTDYRNPPEEQIWQQLREKSHAVFETGHIKKGGFIIPVEINAHIITIRGKKLILSIARDITDRKRAEEALRESEEKFRLIAENSPDHIFIQDRDLVYTWVINPQLDLTLIDMIGKTDYDFLSKEDAHKLTSIKRQVLETGRAIPYETFLLSRHGEPEYFEGAYLPKYDNDGNINGLMGYFRNITQRKLEEERLSEVNNAFLKFHLDPLENINILTELAGKMLKATCALYNRIEGGMICSLGMWNTPPDFNPCNPPEGYICNEVIRKGSNLPTIITNLLESPYASSDPNVRRYHLQTYVGIPVEIKDRDFGSLCVVYQHTYNPTTHDLEFLSLLAKAISIEDKRRNTEVAFQTMVKSMVGTTGINSLWQITENISSWLGAECVMVGEIQPDGQTVQVLSMILDGKEVQNYSYTLKGTPCDDVSEKGFCLYPDNVISLFPESPDLVELNIRGYLGTPLWNSKCKVMGILCALFRHPVTTTIGIREIIEIIAVKAAAEIEGMRMMDALHESEEKLLQVMNGVPTFISYMDTDLRFVLINKAQREWYELSDEDLIGKSLKDLLPEDVLSQILPYYQQVLDGREVMFENPTRDKEGRERVLNVRLVPHMHDKHVVGIFAAIDDITERKQAENAVRMANRKLNLLSGITRHDINNQLLIQGGYLKILQKKQHDPSINEYIQKVITTAERISALIRFTREYERVGIYTPGWQDCHLIVESVVKDPPLEADIVKNDLPIGVLVFSDPLINKVFYNLIDNAVKYSGNIAIIRFYVKKLDEDLIIVVEDDGEGIPNDEKEKIFELGFGKNTGFGLALSREILDITGITIRETGEPGKGARFEITVPDGKWRFDTNCK